MVWLGFVIYSHLAAFLCPSSLIQFMGFSHRQEIPYLHGQLFGSTHPHHGRALGLLARNHPVGNPLASLVAAPVEQINRIAFLRQGEKLVRHGNEALGIA